MVASAVALSDCDRDSVQIDTKPEIQSDRGHMTRFRNEQRALLADRRAVTALEYGIIAGVLGLVLIGIFTSFGSSLTTLFTGIGASI